MDRLRDLATRTRRVDCHFRIPKSLSTTSLMPHRPTNLDEDGDDTSSTISSSSASTSKPPKTPLPGNLGPDMSSSHSDPTPAPNSPSSESKPTPAHPRAHEYGLNSQKKKKTSSINKNKKQPKMKTDKEGQALLEGNNPSAADCEADQRLFNQILTTIAQDDAIADSGLELYRSVNKCARDYMEAKQIVERRENEIAAISTKIEAMQAIMDDASKHLHKAQAIAADAIDSSIAEQFRLREQDNLTNILIGMTNAIAKGNCHIWPTEKVNKYLEDLQSVYHKNKHYCQSPIVSSGIVHVAKHFFFHADYDDAFEPMLFHLANQTDYKGFVERCHKADRELTKQHHVDYTPRPNSGPKATTTTVPLRSDGLTDKTNGSQSGGGAPYKASDGAAEVAQAKTHSSKQDPLQNSTKLTPRSSSLLSAARKTPAKTPGQLDQQSPDDAGDAVSSHSHGETSHVYTYFDFKPDTDMNEVADKIFSQLESQLGMTSDMMNAAVFESITGLETILKDGTAGAPPNVRTDIASTVEHMERLNKEHIKSEQVARKLSAVAETHGFHSVQTQEVPGGWIHVDVTTAGSSQGCACKTACQEVPENKDSHGEISTHHGEDTTAGAGDSDQLWKDHYVSITAPGKH